MIDLKDKRFFLTGGLGFLGSFVKEKLLARGVSEENIVIPKSSEYDLRDPQVVARALKESKPHIVIHLASKVGGIGFNQKYPAEVFYDNLTMGVHLMDFAYRNGVEKFVAIGTICSYPKFTPTPFKEEELWNGYPEETNAPYGLSKKMMLVQAQAYRAQYGWNAIYLLPVNLYGPRDHFDPERSHVIPALIKKISDAKREGKTFIEVWGTGKATREFLYVEDAAEGIILATEKYDGDEPVNLGSGMEISIKDLAEKISSLMDFKGEIRWDSAKPDGQPKRRLDVTRAEKYFGFRATTSFDEGLMAMIKWYNDEQAKNQK